MVKTIKKILIITAVPFVLYYGAVAMFIVEWGMADNTIEQICISEEMQNGVSLEMAQKNC